MPNKSNKSKTPILGMGRPRGLGVRGSGAPQPPRQGSRCALLVLTLCNWPMTETPLGPWDSLAGVLIAGVSATAPPTAHTGFKLAESAEKDGECSLGSTNLLVSTKLKRPLLFFSHRAQRESNTLNRTRKTERQRHLFRKPELAASRLPHALPTRDAAHCALLSSRVCQVQQYFRYFHQK